MRRALPSFPWTRLLWESWIWNEFTGNWPLCPRGLQGVLLSLNRRLAEVNHNLSRLYASKKRHDIKDLKGRDVFDFKEPEQLYTITQGWASLVCQGEKGYVKIAEMEQGDFIGRVPFLDIGHEPDQAVLLPSEDFSVEKISVTEMVTEYENSPNMIQCIASYISNCVGRYHHAGPGSRKITIDSTYLESTEFYSTLNPVIFSFSFSILTIRCSGRSIHPQAA